MSPASKSKSKDKRAAGKDPQKLLTKPTSNANTGVPASGYNPLLGTFHTLDTTPVSTAPSIHINGRSRNFDDLDDHNGNSVAGVEYDTLSNNGSWSGESEDHKDKISQLSTRHDTIPGVDNDKREKIRQKNEKKHQRQKERRAQELHERCSGYLMSRKLESLAQQLVAMGFSSERATMALILNDGRVEQSVAWLLEAGEDSNNHHEHNNSYGGGNLKIDISEELAQITEMELKFKCSKQEVERAIVACEGDLDQAAETLKVQKQEQPPAALPKVEETSVCSTPVNSKLSLTSRPVSKAIPIQQKPDEKDFNYNYTKSSVGPTPTDVGMKNVQLLKKIPSNSSVSTPSVEKRWPPVVGGSNANANSSVSYSLTSPLQAAPPPAKIEPRYANPGTELRNLQLGSVREPVIVMQRPKSKNVTSSVSSSSSASVSDWHPNVVEPVMNMSSNGFSHVPSTTRSFNGSSFGSTVNNSQSYDPFHYQQQQQQQHQPLPQQHYPSSSGSFDHFSQQGGSMNHYNNGGMWNRTVGTNSTPTLAAASSLGLFSGLGSNGLSGPSSPVDWNACDSLQFDYTNIDWSLDRIHLPPSSPSRHNGMWMGSGHGGGGKTATRPPVGMLSNGNNRLSMGLRSDGVGAVGPEASAGGSREWTSAFEEKELFSFPRQFVSSPSL
ncbi:putative UBA-like superfamily, Ubiquitin-associated domain-containing protein [Helianthus annuus]|nr:putative UBA-like superfamily, Ubiquitin-associated domain-containing protein [Helianthus annuus]KAJ0609811.1 putative UBA-like superfamily, Ubiquitin-associated domain-containing protein [Helianthus annuus]KAJ0629523.1 putative UBA-like superfamily, Ubiquitin-associated domain-containing protein [Helianthus annuus]KAJ0769892.1 putative UBA-like superfamily, Ubiquitin-associated domain-containing protein [Helianthus annuus]KAJ0945761.1 putative UBA-like superfamily, Ubiquitin-associated doma